MNTQDHRLIPIRPRIRKLQRDIDDVEWEGLAPEKLLDMKRELDYLMLLDLSGETYLPTF